jgi:hypothetical protein
VDAARAGLAHRSAVFDLTLLRDLRMRLPKGNGDAFREWVLSATDRHLSEIEGLFDIGMQEAANPVFPTTRTVPRMRHVALKMLHGLRFPGF